MNEKRFQKRSIFLVVYLLFALLPIYWMVNMSFKTNEEILSTFTFFPQHFTWANYKTIFTDESWYSGYINSLIYVGINTVISLTVALPAAYAFSRYQFLGDKHVFFWLLTNRMTPPAVFLLPFFQLYTTVGLMDTHIAVALAHLLFSVPLAVWILEGFMSGIPREIDETAYIDGYSFPRFFLTIFTDESWYSGYINSLIYVSINMVITLTVALPAAYAFSRYSFLGDKHVFFWLLTNRMTPPAVFLLPFFQLYTTVGLMDTHIAVALAHLLFSVPLAVWILEGFMSGIPREIDETAYIDGYSFPRFFLTIFLPLIKAGVGVAAFFCFMFSWVELLLSRTLTSVNAKPIAATMTRTVSASGMDWGVLAAAGVLTIIPGALVIWFVRNYIAKGFALGRV